MLSYSQTRLIPEKRVVILACLTLLITQTPQPITEVIMPKRIPIEAYEKAAELLNYNPDTGLFKWKVGGGRRKAGAVAGCSDFQGYWKICVFYQQFKAHRLAWFMVYGTIPDMLDHIDRDKSNNRITNLRVVTDSQNKQNRSLYSNNTSGCAGVHLRKGCGLYESFINTPYGRMRLGYSKTLEEAVRLRTEAVKSYYGEFAPNA